ncbi:putative aminopeptidase [Leishmania mexicana MHOM/GT/2001/U1103]|uniref:Aminopeptidase n=1 Tax=Leishmania mexicana (strain MHOM/GT/2001/U1103) TaxID=929439 RepID=E9B227_LEIMU|nr:putative aminopeptidase [Leishmania mexicana MHOM/GT/2001/U1103]CBZ29284.1 putative aminopeptidase [Leishmania mexicana MHOM/GT/2001/U1103]
MDSSAYIWNPVQCTVQLVFSRPSSGAAIRAGSAYHGTSIIRYRREPYRDTADSAAGTASSSAASPSEGNSEYEDFLRHRRVIAEKNALHLHALTTAGGIYKDARVLDVQSYQVRCVSISADAGAAVLRVVSVEQEDAGAASAGSSTSGGAGKRKGSSKVWKKGGTDVAEHDAQTSGDSPTPAAVDWGSKLILFEGAGSLPPFSEVDLTTQFIGRVQSFDCGGIYAAGGISSNPSTEDVPLLTHFEVRFARCAFPAPDDPQYRLEWQLKSIQVPSSFRTILTNGEERGRKELAAQQAVQVSFAPCGPLPAYVFSFACFPGIAEVESMSAAGDGLEVVEGSLDVPKFAGDIVSGLSDTSNLSHTPVPVRVLARRQARIATATLERVLRLTIESVIALQHLFQCPLPLLQCEHLDVLLGPTMPYISGMEHHCSIILNEAIYQPGRKTAAAGGGSAHSTAEVEQTELIVHELTHHWVGNALGLPFAVKEGICQVIEQCVGDTLLGKPMRTYKADSSGSAKPESSSPSSSTAKPPKSTIRASEKGHEFTGTSYQHALSAIKRLVAEHGFDRFVACLRQLMHVHVVVPAIAVEESGGIQVLRYVRSGIATPPYLSTEQFLRNVESAL